MVTLGTGIGGGVVCGGVLQRGANGFGGEPGHMVVDPKGPPCPCGRRGCWERFASGSGLGRLAREAAESGHGARFLGFAGGDPEDVRGEHVTRAALEGDAEALEVFREFGWWAALGIANLVNLLDPEIVVVGGGLVGAGEVVMKPIRDAFPSLVLAAERRPQVSIVPAQLGNDAGAIGAALIGFDREPR
jgi:glucokinase